MTLQIEQKTYSEELADFLMTHPSLDAIVAHKPSHFAQERMTQLLERNRGGSLSYDEQVELHEILGLSRLMKLLKLKAALQLQDKA